MQQTCSRSTSKAAVARFFPPTAASATALAASEAALSSAPALPDLTSLSCFNASFWPIFLVCFEGDSPFYLEYVF